MTTLRIEGVTASYRDTTVLRGIDLEVASGTTTAVLGPSGCGKTTLLRVVAGFQRPDSGTVALDGQAVVGPGTWVPPERRGVGYVAQEGNLFPHLSVGRNVAFGLPRRQPQSRARVEELLELVGLDPALESRRPDQLSGGQQQRVALARALALRPRLVLLDEPFSSLDAGLRASTRAAVAQALAHEGVTVVLVTHDQAEALSFSDQVAIMRDGRFAQIGSPAGVYSHPVDRASAQFLGDAVVLRGEAAAGRVTCALGELTPADRDCQGVVEVLVRPEQISLHEANGVPQGGALAAGAGVGAGGARAQGEVVSVDYFGHDALVRVRLAGASEPQVVARVLGVAAPPVGSRVGLSVAGEARVFPVA